MGKERGKQRLKGKKALILRMLREGPKSTQEIYSLMGAKTESQKANIRKALSLLKRKGLIVKVPGSSYWAITEKGLKVLECLEVIEEVEAHGAPGGI